MTCSFHASVTTVIIAVACLGALWLSGTAHATVLEDAVERGIVLLNNGDIDAARTTLAAAGEGEETSPTLLAARGLVEAFAGSATTEAFFRRALEQDPHSRAALWGLSLYLLQHRRAYEATALIERAAADAPQDARIKTLQAYVYLLLGRTAEAAGAGKVALEAGQSSPFLLATLAQIHRNLGYTKKAVDFGRLAAKQYANFDFLATERGVSLPLTMTIADSPQVLSELPTERIPPASPTVQRTDLMIELPKIIDTATPKDRPFQIVAPQDGATLRGQQWVRVAYHGTHEVKFVILLADHVMRGILTEMPYHFAWDADAMTPGSHQLCVRAYDEHGMILAEDAITVETPAGKAQLSPGLSERAQELQQQMIALAMPLPTPLSLFTQLGWWYKDLGETAEAQTAFEKAAAIDPGTEGILEALSSLYQDNGMHLISSSGEVVRGPEGKDKRVALTFDDGPNAMYTPALLTELKRYNAHATFFIVGKMAEKYPEQLLAIMAQGHELANHSYTHPNMTKLTRQEIIAEVLRTRAAIKEIAGQQTYLFRPPGGDIDPFVTRQLRALDYNIVYWDVNAGEYRKAPTPAAQAAQIMAHVQSGSIILMHNGVIDGTLNFLPMLLEELTKAGYSCVTVSELMKG